MYSGSVTSPHGLSLWRFSAPRAVLDSAEKNPENAGFCTPAGNCLGSGVLNISTCQTCKLDCSYDKLERLFNLHVIDDPTCIGSNEIENY